MVDPELNEVPTITELVRRRTRSGMSSRELERLSGGKVAHQRFDDLEQGKVAGFPKSAEAIEAQATALGVDARQLVLAYAKQIGVDLRENRSLLASMLPANARNLTARQTTVLVDLIGEMAAPTPREGIDLSGFPDDELRDVTRFWQELSARRPNSTPALSAVIGHVMATIDEALANATNDR